MNEIKHLLWSRFRMDQGGPWPVRGMDPSVRGIVQNRNHFKALTLRYAWHDDFMTWNPDMHGGIKQIVVNADS